MEIRECIALVTGGASGLGEASVRMILSMGGKAAILDMAEERGRKLAEELGPGAIFCQADVTAEESVKAAIDQAAAEFGTVNLVINCAGIGVAQKVVGKQGPHDLALFNRVIQVNLVGSFNMIRLTAARMQGNKANAEGERGVIINTSSVAAFEGQIGQAAYSASKAGIAGMTLPIARELALHGIRVMTIAPGLFDTPMFDSLPENARTALGAMVPFPSRLGYPAEYARLVRGIVENPMLNGSTIRLDGAIRMQPK